MFDKILALIMLEKCSKQELKVIFAFSIFMLLTSLYGYSAIKPEIQYRQYIEKTITIKGPFKIRYTIGGGKRSSTLKIIANSFPQKLSSSCGGGVKQLGLCNNNKYNLTTEFSEKYSIDFYVSSIERDNFFGLIESIRDVDSGDYVFLNNDKNSFVFRQNLLYYSIVFFVVIVFWCTVVSMCKILFYDDKD